MNRILIASLLTIIPILVAEPLQAQTDTLTRADVEAMLAERDAVIIELQNRIRILTERMRELEDSSGAGTQDEGVFDSEATQNAGDDRDVDSATASDAGRLEVDEVAAERALERTLVQSGALLLPRGRMEFVPTLSHLVSETVLPVSVDMSSGAVVTGETTRRIAALDLVARVGLPGDSQLEIGLPYLSINEEIRVDVAGITLAEQDQTASGTGDLRLGVAKTLLRESGWRPDIVGRLTYGFGNGDQLADGVLLGGGFEYLNASLSFVKRRDPLALFFSLDYTDTWEENGMDPGDAYSVSLGTALAVSPESSLFGSVRYTTFSGTRVDDLEVPGSDAELASISLGLSTILRRGQLLNVFSEIGLSDEAPDYSLSFSLPVQW